MIESLNTPKTPRSVLSTLSVQLTVIIPAWNEEWCIANSLTTIQAVLQGIPEVELLVVDDGSSDNTVMQVQEWIKEHQDRSTHLITLRHNSGKGRAVLEGVRRARGHYVAYIDADLDIPAYELSRLYRIAHEYPNEIIVGSKQHGLNQRAAVSPFRQIVSWSFAHSVQWLFRLPVHDTQTGLKIFPGQWIRQMAEHVTVIGYLFDVELLILAHKAHVGMHEVPIQYVPQRRINRIRARHILRSLWELAKLYHRYRLTGGNEDKVSYANFDA
jgi:glycosyltransferase involved in cell wall biosynthesis